MNSEMCEMQNASDHSCSASVQLSWPFSRILVKVHSLPSNAHHYVAEGHIIMTFFFYSCWSFLAGGGKDLNRGHGQDS